MGATFNPLPPRETAADACAAAIRAAILRGELPVGSRLPPERKLAETFGVNRVTVRSALTQLAARGLVTVRQGSGYRVEDFRRVGGLDLVPPLLSMSLGAREQLEVITDLLALRRRLAGLVLERLAAQPPDALAPLSDAIDAFAEAARTGDEATVAEADLEVLATLLGATGSAALQLCFNPVLSVLTQLPVLRTAMYAEPESNVAAYGMLLAWLRTPADQRGSTETIVALLERRDERTLERVRASLEATDDAPAGSSTDERRRP